MLDATELMKEDRLELLQTFTDGLDDCKKVVESSIVKISKNSLSVLNKFLKKMIKISDTIEKDILPSSQYDEKFKMVALEDNEKLREILQQAEELFQKAQSFYRENDMNKYINKSVKKLKLPTLIVSKTKDMFSKIGLRKPQTKDAKVEKEEKSVGNEREQLARDLEAQAFEAKAEEALKGITADPDQDVKAEVSDAIQQIQSGQTTPKTVTSIEVTPVRETEEEMQQRLNNLMPGSKSGRKVPTPNKNKSDRSVDDILKMIRTSPKGQTSSTKANDPLKSIEKPTTTKLTTDPISQESKEQPRVNSLYDAMMANLKKMGEAPELPESGKSSYQENEADLHVPRFIHHVDEAEYELSSVEEEKPDMDIPFEKVEIHDGEESVEKTQNKDENESSNISRKLDKWRMMKQKISDSGSFIEEQMRKDPMDNFVKSGGAQLITGAYEQDAEKNAELEKELTEALASIEATLNDEELTDEARKTLESASISAKEALNSRKKADDLGSASQHITIQANATAAELARLREECDAKMEELKKFAANISAVAERVKIEQKARQTVYTNDLTARNNSIKEYEEELRALRAKRAALEKATDQAKETYDKFSAANGIKK